MTELFHFGFIHVTVRSLLLLAAFIAFSAWFLLRMKKAAFTAKQTCLCLCAGFAGMLILGKIGNLLVGGRLFPLTRSGCGAFFALGGFLLGLYAVCMKEKGLFGELIGVFALPVVLLGAVLEGSDLSFARAEVGSFGLFTASDALDCPRGLPGCSAAAALCAVALIVFLARRVFKERFRPSAMALFAMCAGVTAVFDATRGTYAGGAPVLLTAIELLTAAALNFAALRRSDLPGKAASLVCALAFPLITALLLRASAWTAALVWALLSQAALFSPLFPLLTEKRARRTVR